MKNRRFEDDVENWKEKWRSVPMRSAFLSSVVLVVAATFLKGAPESMMWGRYLVMLVALFASVNLAIGPMRWLWKGAVAVSVIGLGLEMIAATLT